MNGALSARLREYFREHPKDISAVVPFDKSSDKLLRFDFTTTNTELDPAILGNTEDFSAWVRQKLDQNNCRYGIGGYNEHRTIYSRSELFGTNEEPRRLHLGVDIWGPEGTLIFSPLNGNVHSFRFNDNFGDYGATLVLQHQFDGITFHSLYGHLSLQSIACLDPGAGILKGEKIAEFGNSTENGHWPPHLHFQLIFDMKGMSGDYPGVCRYSEKEAYLQNCPDPDILLKHTFGY